MTFTTLLAAFEVESVGAESAGRASRVLKEVIGVDLIQIKKGPSVLSAYPETAYLRNTVKVLLHIMMTGLVLLSSIDVPVSVHWCGETVAEIAISGTLEVCCKPTPVQDDLAFTKSGCCDIDVHWQSAVDHDHSPQNQVDVDHSITLIPTAFETGLSSRSFHSSPRIFPAPPLLRPSLQATGFLC